MGEETSFVDGYRPMMRLFSVSRKGGQIENKEARWVGKNLTTKKDTSDSSDDRNEASSEVPVTAFGEMQFKGATRRAKSKVS